MHILITDLLGNRTDFVRGGARARGSFESVRFANNDASSGLYIGGTASANGAR